jgi:hypothetical protein
VVALTIKLIVFPAFWVSVPPRRTPGDFTSIGGASRGITGDTGVTGSVMGDTGVTGCLMAKSRRAGVWSGLPAGSIARKLAEALSGALSEPSTWSPARSTTTLRSTVSGPPRPPSGRVRPSVRGGGGSQARRALERLAGGDGIDLAAEYWLIEHPIGAAAWPRDRTAEELGPLQSAPIVRGRRGTLRSGRGAELSRVDGLVAVADDRHWARLALARLAADRAPIGVVEED